MSGFCGEKHRRSYISVHATDDDVRAYMLSQPKGRGIMERLRRLRDVGIHFECQAVLVGGVNDGPVLEKTIRDLETLYPYAESLALVPLGLTGHREGLKQLAPIDKKCAEGILDIAEKWQGHFLKKYGTRFVFGADELYIKAGRPIPAYETYEDFKQMEDGVGLLRYLTDETRRALPRLKGYPGIGRFPLPPAWMLHPISRRWPRNAEKSWTCACMSIPSEMCFSGRPSRSPAS